MRLMKSFALVCAVMSALSAGEIFASSLSCQDVPGGTLTYAFGESNGGAFYRKEKLIFNDEVLIDTETSPVQDQQITKAYFHLTGNDSVLTRFRRKDSVDEVVIFLSEAEITNDATRKVLFHGQVLCQRTLYHGPMNIPSMPPHHP